MENVIEIENKIPEQPEAPAPDKKKLDPVKREKIKRIVVLLAPIIGLGLLVLAYIILGTINDIRFDKGIQAIINSAVVCAVVATGATFIYALGSFDISLGAATLVSALLGAMAYNASGSLFVMILVCILVGVGVELVSSALASFLNLPVFITTVAMMSIEKQYNVDFIYSDVLDSADKESAAIDTMVANNCKAIISFSSSDRPAQIKKCEKEKVYYAVATGALTEEDYNTYKSYEYYVGAIGPSNNTEFQVGYDMAKYYLDAGKTKFGIFGGSVMFRDSMHVNRVAGMIQAMIDEGGEGANYGGATNASAVIGSLMATGAVTPGAIGDNEILSYVGGWPGVVEDYPTFMASCGSAVTAGGLEVMLAVDSGYDFFGASKPASVKIAQVGSYVEATKTAMSAGTLDYLAGKFSSSIGPIFMATLRAVNGNKVKTADGYALALDQGYWVSKSSIEYNTKADADSTSNPAYSKAVLDQLLEASYNDFSTFVGKYSYDEIKALKD